jgi:hypothetical protein
MADIYHGKGHFKRMPRSTRNALVDSVFDVLDAHHPTLIMVGIHKRAHNLRYAYPDPVENVAYRFMIERYNTYLGRQSDHRGIVVCDEQKELATLTRRAHSQYRREGTEWTEIESVIETAFFTPSHWSRMLQVVDVVTYWTARYLRSRLVGTASPRYWARIEPHLDCHPLYRGKGLKVFPSH